MEPPSTGFSGLPKLSCLFFRTRALNLRFNSSLGRSLKASTRNPWGCCRLGIEPILLAKRLQLTSIPTPLVWQHGAASDRKGSSDNATGEVFNSPSSVGTPRSDSMRMGIKTLVCHDRKAYSPFIPAYLKSHHSYHFSGFCILPYQNFQSWTRVYPTPDPPSAAFQLRHFSSMFVGLGGSLVSSF